MTPPKAVTDLTPACEAFVDEMRATQAAYKTQHRAGKYWRSGSPVRKIVEVPDGVDEFGNPKTRREYQQGMTPAEAFTGKTIPASVDIEVSEYQSPRGNGWFATFTAKPTGGWILTIDGDGPETFGHDWREVVAE